MALWFLYTAHDYGIQSETVEAAQAMVDRVSSIDTNITEDFDLYQISCFVCLLIACKTMETKLFFKYVVVAKYILSQAYLRYFL